MKMGLFILAATFDKASPGPAPREPSISATMVLVTKIRPAKLR